MLLCLFVFLWKIIRNMSTISATIQHERQLELLKQQLAEHQQRNLRHKHHKVQQQQQQQQQLPSQSVKQTHYQKLRKLGRDKAATKENFLLHRFLFDSIPENGVMSGGGDGCCVQEERSYPVSGVDEMSRYSEKEVKFLRMSDHPNRQHGKFVLQQHQQQNHHKQRGSPIRRPLASNANFWPNSGNVPHPTPTPAAATETTTAVLAGEQQQQQQRLSEENLKTNVQIVLDNINRNYHALREQILNGNNCNTQSNLALLQKLQSVSQQLKKGKAKMTSPDSDTNCNPYGPPLSCSVASSQDFSNDCSDYQWFTEYGYRDGITHQSILSALSASYQGVGELSYYEDLARNIDANLAEVDIDSFRAADIHSLLSAVEIAEQNRNNNGGGVNPILSNGGGGNGAANVGMDLDHSICNSELLFSPVRESHISVDSLDMDGYPNEEIILTCQANKNNYTLAFEQSTLYSDESFYDGPEKQLQLLSNLDYIIRKTAQEDATMSCSEVGYTTWSNLRRYGAAQRYPLVAINPLINQISRHSPTCFVRKSLSMPDLKEKCNNHNNNNALDAADGDHNEDYHPHPQHQLNVSQAAVANSGATSRESFGKQMRTLLPMYSVPTATTDSGNESVTPLKESNLDNNNEEQQHTQQPNQPSFNLVKLFIKQKSSSTETCMNVSSDHWPSDSTNSASGGDNNNSSSSSNANLKERCRKKSMNDSGKCSNMGRHAEDDFQFDSLDVQINHTNNNEADNDTTTTTTTAGDRTEEPQEQRAKLNDFNSPAHKRNYKAYNLNIANKNMPAVNPIVYNLMNNTFGGDTAATGGELNSSSIINNNNNNSFKDTNSDASRTSENLTQIFNINQLNARTNVPIEMITRSMQTSFIGPKEKVRVIPPSFLERLNKLGDKQKAPVFVVYPNYVLPDLGFIRDTDHDISLILSPHSFKENLGQTQLQQQQPRPVDIENIKTKKYNKHLVDWKSLVTLLPQEYRKLLRDIPEANECSFSEDAALRRPLFCMTPPLRRRRGVTCDCAYLINNQTYNSSHSSSQPPSSGYRGSSTMLTDSEMNESGGAINNNLYVYQYDSPAEVPSTERPPSGRSVPKSILRRPPTKPKRNSMFEENQNISRNVEKRRSLQEPCYTFNEEHLIPEDDDSINELPDVCLRRVNNSPNMSQHQARLPNALKLASADDYHRLNKLNEMNDVELNKAVSSKLNRAQQHQQRLDDEMEARIHTEQFLSHVPKSELKHYAEIVQILEADQATTGPSEDAYDRTRLRHEVSRALSQRKNVSFNAVPAAGGGGSGVINTTPVRQQPQSQPHPQLLRPTEISFVTPPNSPNVSVTVVQKRPHKPTPPASLPSPVGEKQDKIQSNRFKRLQIQWELLSKEGQQLRQELQQPRSGGNTPTSATKSRIPRPVSYPTTRANSDPAVSKTLRSPSRIVPPKRYSAAATTASPSVVAPMPAPRASNKPLHTTPKKSAAAAVGTPRPATRTRIPHGPGQSKTSATTTPSTAIPKLQAATTKSTAKRTTTTPVISKPKATAVVCKPVIKSSRRGPNKV
ncbi:uncharacterized protein LOC129762945 [Toxorhynchites rutilus septentrionalis]|uniref:uncharacterized protein LOC129762945 n=1 Tax=Toxorhynchites rutilus septentrionalis TaxID=329112 RepID=UPI00247A4745|nr:uncharacterized protein LOC129762945 [Toxorhynchites rutilus septentrionalis]